jgi:hypothetical protein
MLIEWDYQQVFTYSMLPKGGGQFLNVGGGAECFFLGSPLSDSRQ